MIGVAMLSLAVALVAIGGVVYFAKVAIDLARTGANAVTTLDADRVRQANVATTIVDGERAAAQARLNDDEAKAHDALAATALGAGDDPLRASLSAHPANITGGADDHSITGRMPAPRSGGPAGSGGASF